MVKILRSFALLIWFFLGISANILKNNLDFQQNKDAAQITIQKSDNFPVPPHCGFGKKPQFSTTRIFNGTRVEQHELPWMVYLPMTCGGTLINSRWILTAAHCFNDVLANVAYIGAMKCALKHCDSNATVVHISKIIIHEDYDSHELYNDIALIQLKDAVTFSEAVQPICLPYDEQGTGSNIFNKKSVVSGWGQNESCSDSVHLLKTTVTIWEADRCQAFRDMGDIKSDQHICAGGTDGKDACFGDSGGPLSMQLRLKDGSKPYYQFGIVSFSDGCGKLGYPGVYTNVANYIQWIRNTINANE